DHVIAITSQVADELEKRGVDRKNISIAENAVDPEAILPLPKDIKYAASRKIRTDVPVIGFAGSVVPYEGLTTLVEASSLLNDRGIDHQVVIAGSGDRKSTRLNSSHVSISYAVFCLKKKRI